MQYLSSGPFEWWNRPQISPYLMLIRRNTILTKHHTHSLPVYVLLPTLPLWPPFASEFILILLSSCLAGCRIFQVDILAGEEANRVDNKAQFKIYHLRPPTTTCPRRHQLPLILGQTATGLTNY